MTWQPEVDELRRRQELAERMGGPDKIRRQHDAGRLTVRERIEALLDAGSFREIGILAGVADYDGDGELAGFTPANFVTGTGRVAGRKVVVGGDDFTVRGGAGDAAIAGKQIYAEQLANELRLPLVRLIEGTGGGGSVKMRTEDPAALLAEIRARLDAVRSPLRTAEGFGVEEIIDPRETRPLLCEWVRDAYAALPVAPGRPSFGARP